MYDDITDWASDSYPMENYDSANEWIADVMNDFKRQGHFFPAGMVTELNAEWIAEMGADNALTRGEIAEAELDVLERSAPNRVDYPDSVSYQIAKNAHDRELETARGKVTAPKKAELKRLRERDQRIELERLRRKKKHIDIEAKKRRVKLELESKRKKRRESKQKFTKRTTKAERKRKRGIGR